MLRGMCFGLVVLAAFAITFTVSQSWSGNYQRRYGVTGYRSVWYCRCRYWYNLQSWCPASSYYLRPVYGYIYLCKSGWTTNSYRNCNIPICRPSCLNGGICTHPNQCDCPSTSAGGLCQTLTCSYQRPCYPGDCVWNSCTCEPAFYSTNPSDGCININSTAEEFRPEIVKSNVTLGHIRRPDNITQFMFTVVGKDENDFIFVWSNQNRFNNLRFEFDTLINIPEIPERPVYVNDAKIGIVPSSIEASVSKIPRDGSSTRYIASNKTYNCETGISEDNPEVEKNTCEINDENFATLIEHGDILLLRFRSRSGGFQKLINIDDRGKPYATKHYNGLHGEENLEFRFDSIVPEHCSLDSGSCLSKPLHIDDEFTRSTIQIRWSGWTDAMSGMWQYYFEVFKLAPNGDGKLEEATPINPVFNRTLSHTDGEISSSFTPDEPGMYSVLLKAFDIANNSRIARRFVLYDDTSVISMSNETDKKLYIASAMEETGYAWQTTSNNNDTTVTVNVSWDGHFANRLHEDGKFLAEIEEFPIQFKEIEDEGILMSLKFVSDSLDDDEGERTRKAIPNYHGIVQFEVAYEQSASEEVPTGWSVVGLQERTSSQRTLENGDRLRVWVKATDLMGNTRTDSTLMRFDGSPPTISSGNSSDHRIELNIFGGAYRHSSRANFLASDRQSGVHKIGIKLTVKLPGKDGIVAYDNFTEAMRGDGDVEDPRCIGLDQNGRCLLPEQIVDIDNCWLTVGKEDLETATAELEITAYNQAMLTATTIFDMGPLRYLQGLEKYNGPTNLRIEHSKPTSFRLKWDHEESESCYWAPHIIIIITFKDLNGEIQMQSFEFSSTLAYYDIGGLYSEVEYNVELRLRSDNGHVRKVGENLSVVTPHFSPEEDLSRVFPTGAVVGITVGILLLCVIFVLLFIKIRGIIKEKRKKSKMPRAITNCVHPSASESPQGSLHENHNNANENLQSELYLYGEMDFNSSSKGYISSDNITFIAFWKSGHFANIYHARYNGQNVVAKTLKENFSKNDELQMKAKLNFSSVKAGDHPSIIKFVGAVVDNVALGPIIIYELCEIGSLRHHLQKNKYNFIINMQENLFRFGLDIAKGMEFLAFRGVTHRRLAARNILLNFLNEAKIAGFGPQPSSEDNGGEVERVPMKWTAPECMTATKKANEKSDVWSYAVVLWEIFSLGETPYTGKSRKLPQRLKRGERLGKPGLCDDTWYKVMQQCWEYDPQKRPSFAEIREQLDTMFVASPGDGFDDRKR